MAEVLLISPDEIAATTIMNGNVDPQNYTFCIAEAQVSYLEPLLGTELYDKMITDFTVPTTYAGLYATLYTDYIVPIVKYQATANYIEIASYKLANGGLFKHSPENSEVVDNDEAKALGQRYRNMADMIIIRFNKWIGLNEIAEYKTSQDEVNASKTVQSTGLWWFGTENTDY